MTGRRTQLRVALMNALLALPLAVGTASAHGGGDAPVIQRYDELFIVGAVAFILTLTVGALLLFGPLKQRKSGADASSRRRNARPGPRPRVSSRSH